MILKIVVIIFMIFVVVILLEMKRELSTFKTVHYEIEMQGLKNEKKAVFLSDLHNHVYGENNHKLVEAIRLEYPDYILIGGDMLVGKDGEGYQDALTFVKQLSKICPVYYANGNHEQRMKEIPENYSASYEEYKKELVLAGIIFLENDSVYLKWPGINIKLTGLEIPLRCYTHFHKEHLDEIEIIERIGLRENGVYEIVMAHNPSYMNVYKQRGADLILSGHLHGGIVRIPGVAGAISPSFEIFPKYSGDHYHEKETDIVVSKGLGTHTFNIRLFNPAELIVLNFKGDTCIINDCEKIKRG